MHRDLSSACRACFALLPAALTSSGFNQGEHAKALPAERQCLTTTLYTADPSAHVFDGKIFIYGSHDIATTVPADIFGSQYDTKDYQGSCQGRVRIGHSVFGQVTPVAYGIFASYLKADSTMPLGC